MQKQSEATAYPALAERRLAQQAARDTLPDAQQLDPFQSEVCACGKPVENAFIEIFNGRLERKRACGKEDDLQALSLQSLRNLSQSDILLASLPGLYYRLLKTDTNTRTLANPQLRTSEGMPAQARFGERVPVPASSSTRRVELRFAATIQLKAPDLRPAAILLSFLGFAPPVSG